MPAQAQIAMAVRADFSNPHHQEVIEGLQQYASLRPAWRCVIDEYPADSDDLDAERYDGVVARASAEMQKRMRDQRIPIVNVWYQHASPGQPGVYLDAAKAGCLAAEHLIHRGFRRLCYLGMKKYRASKVIQQGITQTTQEYHCYCETHSLRNHNYADRRSWYELKSQITTIIDAMEPPFGVIALFPTDARLMLTLAESRGLRVPIDLAMVCMENLRAVVELPTQITCIDNDFTRVGFAAGQMLNQIMDGQTLDCEEVLIPPRGIVTRESTDYFAVNDEIVVDALRFISAHLGEKLTVDRVANEINVSTRTLQNRFDQTLGRPVSQEIRRLRLELAMRLLGQNSLLVGEIAKLAGFTSSAIMSEIFQRELAKTPSEYRKQIVAGFNRKGFPEPA